MSENKEMPAKKAIVHPRTELRWPPFHSNLLNEAFLTSVKGVFDEMLGRLYYGADKRKGWATAEPWKELTEHECRTCIRDSLAKGNLVDAMNYLMFAHLNGHKLPTLCAPYSVDSQMREQLAKALGVAGRSWDEMLDTASKWAKIAAKAESISETLKTAYEKEKLVEKIAQELKLDPEASEERILSTIHMLVTIRQAELKSEEHELSRPDGNIQVQDSNAVQMHQQLANALNYHGHSWDDTLSIVRCVLKDWKEARDEGKKVRTLLGLSEETDTDILLNAVRPEKPKSDAHAVTEISITGGTDPDVLENAAKLIRANSQRAAFAWDGRTKNTVTIKNEAAPDLFPEQRITVKKATVTIDGLDLTTIAEELKWPHTTPPEGEDKTRKTVLPNAMAAPYGVTTAYDKAAEDCQGVVYEKFAPELRPSTPDTNDDLCLTMVADDSGIRSTLFRFKNEKDRDDYMPLLRTFLGALEQAAYGKGRERHANDLPFTEQPILTMARMLDSDAGLAQQVIKKTIEARSLPTKQARINELRGTLVYAAAMILFEEMYGRADDPDNLNGAL